VRQLNINKKLQEIDFDIESISLGDFDYIGEFTAKKNRNRNHDLFKSTGCFFRPNYERGILIYALITKFKIESFLEIGFGRGYSSMCAALAFKEAGIDGKVVTIDPGIDEQHLKNLSNVFPKEWFDLITFIKQTSQVALPQIKETFDLVLIDGDHTLDAVSSDWAGTKDKYNKFLIFDDYHLPTKKDPGGGIQCAKLIDTIDDDSKELIIMDRRIFVDDRKLPDDKIDYGQVILTNSSFDTSDFVIDW